MQLPDVFVEKVNRTFGDDSRRWLPKLPDILARCREKWGLPEGAMCPDMSMNYIEFTTTPAGEQAALKVGVPHEELFTEMETLRGRMVCRPSGAGLSARSGSRAPSGTRMSACRES